MPRNIDIFTRDKPIRSNLAGDLAGDWAGDLAGDLEDSRLRDNGLYRALLKGTAGVVVVELTEDVDIGISS